MFKKPSELKVEATRKAKVCGRVASSAPRRGKVILRTLLIPSQTLSEGHENWYFRPKIIGLKQGTFYAKRGPSV